MIEDEITLRYALAPGWMAPFVDALMMGQALARSCGTCARISFPPTRRCDCGNNALEWTLLSGKAAVVLRTEGQDGSFGLVRFEGADNMAVAQLRALPARDSHGVLLAPEGHLPALALGQHRSEVST